MRKKDTMRSNRLFETAGSTSFLRFKPLEKISPFATAEVQDGQAFTPPVTVSTPTARRRGRGRGREFEGLFDKLTLHPVVQISHVKDLRFMSCTLV